MCEYIGIPKGTKIDLDVLQKIEHAPANEKCTIMGKEILISMSMKGTAGILIKKIREDKAWVA